VDPEMRRTPILILLVGAGILPSTFQLQAQRYYRGYSEVRLGHGLPDRPGGFTFCRLAYASVRRDSSGNGWDTDFPQADRNLPTRLSELTPTPVSGWSHGEQGFAIVRVTDPEVYECPFLMATDVGELGFNEEEVAAMRDFLMKGGFLWADDFWGSAGWDHFARQMKQVMPDREIVDLPLDHALYSIVYNVSKVPQIPSINSWRRLGGGTSEMGIDSATPHMRAIFDDEDRLLVLITHNTDISDGWEREGEDADFFYQFSPDAYAIGINVVLWTLTH
jgi:hypothetical protein